MKITKDAADQELFVSIDDHGTRWLFIVAPDDQWAITRDGEKVAAGSAERRSLQNGIEKFMTLTHPAVAVAICDPIVREHLNRIETASCRAGNAIGVAERQLTRRPIGAHSATAKTH